jgi:cyclophilin family peptidyl-prolyl cis-trans isomerase
MRRPLLALASLAVAASLGLSACGDDSSSSGTPAETSADVVRTYEQPPPREIDVAKNYTATLITTLGDIVIKLDPKAAPNTVNNFVVLARKDFYDGLTFHRVVADFVVQGGDPNGDGTGGPGYQFPDELPKDGYKIGSVAMANSGPDTNGSQFFIVTGPNGAGLPPAYSRFGQVTKGQDVAKKIEQSEVEPGTETPTPPVTIIDVEIVES